MRFTDQFLDEIKYRNDIEEVIGSYVQLRRAGSNLQGLCPFHSEKSPSFTVFSGTKGFYCFGCGAGGDVITFIMRAENLDYPSAVAFLAKRAGLEMPIDTGTREEQVKRTRILEMNKEAARFFRDALMADQNALGYLTARGLSMPIIRRFGLGYDPGPFALANHLQKKGYSVDEMVAACLCGVGKNSGKPYDFFRGRVIFPIIDVTGNVIAFGGRTTDGSLPKYLNSPDTPVFKKSRNLFALNYAKNHASESLILCEGYMDVIALHAAGFENAVATLGTAITSEQARIMRRYTEKVFVSYDSDEAGQKAADKAIRLLTEVGLDVKIIRMRDAKDPDEFIKKFGRDRFKLLLGESRSKFDFKLEGILGKYDLYVPEEKLKAVHAVADELAAMESAAAREVYLRRAAERIELSVESLKAETDRAIHRREHASRQNTWKQITGQAAGLGDRINPDHAKNPKAAAAEEAILGILLLHPELVQEVANGKIVLTAEHFFSTFHKRVFEAILTYGSDGRFDIAKVGELFSVEEIGRITKLQVDRAQLSNNDGVVLQACIESLKSAGKQAQTDALAAIMARRNQKNEPKGEE